MKVLRTVLLSCLLLTGCGGGGGGGGGSAVTTGVVSGVVVDATDHEPLAGAVVSIGSAITTSAGNGTFSLDVDPSERAVLRAEAEGFAEGFKVVSVEVGETSVVGVQLLPIAITTPVDPATGGSVTIPDSQSQVTFPAGALVPAGGGEVAASVNVSLTPIDPSVDIDLMPGDMNAVVAGGGDGTEPLESFGALWVDIRDASGAPYELQDGMSATIRIALGTLSSDPPNEIPLYYFDEDTGLWVAEGTATLQGTAPDQYYEGEVSHFSTWNADQPIPTVTVSGCVVNDEDVPAVGVALRAVGVDYSGSTLAITDTNGHFTMILRQDGIASLSSFTFSFDPYGFIDTSDVREIGPFDGDDQIDTCLVLIPNVEITTAATLPAGIVGTDYSKQLEVENGTGPYTWSITSGTLPAGLSLNPSTGVISGTPTAAAQRNITVRVQDSSVPAKADSRQFSIAITAAPVVGGGAYGSVTITGAPSAVGGSFIPSFMIPTTPINGITSVGYSESNGAEGLGVGFAVASDNFNNVSFTLNSTMTWQCSATCIGLAINRSAGTVTFVNTELAPSLGGATGTLILNGTLQFPPL